jgi:DNA-binding ferritin-like protein (Dps family)
LPSRQFLDQIVELFETAVADRQRAAIVVMIDAHD